MMKISSQYLFWFQIAVQLKNLGNHRPTFGRKGKRRPFSPKRRPTIAKIFQLNSNKSGTNGDIGLKFSAFVHHMSGLNWQKNFGHCSISWPVAPSSIQKLCTPLATIFVEKKFWKKSWCGFRPIRVTPWREFLISWKKWRFEIFRTTAESRASDPWFTKL